ncbi:TspO/MBR family protein [Leifsonia sp. F6_8S_P_1B]|uniref:TspO/MBR family protein n=1 Tax=Leifsonia williamsii TaxID=3035919 RepID=A0ABT8KA00_9MICO|nr:TspO/MBR family protein [Leifsonia williamsii]MDN4613307.1 TspO/MBR family protein [Leifsonia williamsii]
MSTLTRRATQPLAVDRVRQIVILIGAVVAIIGAFVGSGAVVGTPIQKVAGGALSADATFVAPAGPAFAIWSVVYAGLALYAIWQALPSQAARERQRVLGWWVLASLLLNAAWILSVQAGLLGLSVAVIVALLAVLVTAFVLLRRHPSESTADAVLLDGTMGLYLGWVMVATVANVTAWLTAAGFDGFGWSPHAWALALLAVVAVLGSSLAIWSRGRLTPSLALAWGLCWIGVSRLTGELLSAPVAVTAFAAAAIVLLVTVAVRVARGPMRRD